MLNGRNWWTDKAVDYDYKEDLDARIQEAANIIWEDWFGSALNEGITGPSHLADAIRQATQIVNNPGIDPRKFL
jgi:hypothetical protein